jgi:hypothetical protein
MLDRLTSLLYALLPWNWKTGLSGTCLAGDRECVRSSGESAIGENEANGATLVIVNREPTGLNRIADLVLNRAIGETLGIAVGVD